MSVAAVKGQCQTLLGRLEVLKLGTAAATGMRQGRNIVRLSGPST